MGENALNKVYRQKINRVKISVTYTTDKELLLLMKKA